MISNIPQNVGRFHFIGIGGIGMSGIAEILIQSGYVVQGSDINQTKITKRLKILLETIFQRLVRQNLYQDIHLVLHQFMKLFIV